jgi:hypothetical protein
MPRSSASEGAFTRFTSSSVWPASTPLSTLSVSSRVSFSATLPRYSISTPSTEDSSASAIAIRPR